MPTHVLFRPHELMEKLAALVPPPRRHTVHYHGVLAPHAAWRPHLILPAPALLVSYGLPTTVPTPASPRAGPDSDEHNWT